MWTEGRRLISLTWLPAVCVSFVTRAPCFVPVQIFIGPRALPPARTAATARLSTTHVLQRARARIHASARRQRARMDPTTPPCRPLSLSSVWSAATSTGTAQ